MWQTICGFKSENILYIIVRFRFRETFGNLTAKRNSFASTNEKRGLCAALLTMIVDTEIFEMLFLLGRNAHTFKIYSDVK